MLLSKKQVIAGFTLIEMIIVMIILGILAGSLAQFTSLSFQVYREVEQSTNLTYLADTVLQQMTRNIRLAAPNSARITHSGRIVALEFHQNGHPVSYLCNFSAGQITYHTNYSPSPIQKTVLPGGNLLVNQVSACDFSVVPSTATRGELVKLMITLADMQNDTSITLFQQIAVRQE
jgi:prepilin-type N-terminal cleavage/methylation domain-containing protein